MELTAEQRAVVEAGDVDLAVTAGAGSGKTHVLVERYVALLERCRIPEIAAVTFTEAAATEMRERVRHEVLTRPDLARHRADVDEAVIGTIHSFCLGLLRDHPVEARIDPAVSVLAEDAAELLRRSASGAAIDDAAGADDVRIEALRALGVYPLSQLLPTLLAARDDVANAFAALGPDASAAERLRERMAAACEDRVRPLRDEVCERLDELLSYSLAGNDRLVTAIDAAAAASRAQRDASWTEWVDTVPELLGSVDLRPGSKTAWTIPKTEVTQGFARIRDRVRRAMNDLPRWNEDDDVAIAVMPGLRALFEDACTRYEAAKVERGGLDFLDLELHAVGLLADSRVCEETRTRFRHLMVDEAQDVSALQARLVRRLIEGPGERPRLLLVGDEKQSIYGFRGADVRQFRALRQLVRSSGGLEVDLSRSFRTHGGLVRHTNDLFASVFSGEGAPTMTSMTGRPAPPPTGPHLVVTPLATTGRDARANRRRRLAEAALVAEQIEALLNEARPVWDKRLAAYRALQQSDIAILLRRFANVHLFEQALEARSLDYATPSGTGFFSRQEVLDLENLLRWLAEPDDDIALVAILRSPLFIVADDVLFALRQSGRPLLAALHEPPAPIAPDDAARCRFAADVLTELRRRARTEAAVDLLEHALTVTGFEASWAPLAGGEQALANIRKLVRIVRSLPGFSISEVAEYLLQRREDLEAREGPAILDRPDAIQIMTVHGAKGLEFPVVFVPEAHTSVRDQTPPLLWRPDLGLSCTLEPEEDGEQRRRPGLYRHLRALESADERDEHVRLFYVASTRAGDYLYLSGDAGQNDGWLHAVEDAAAAGMLDGIELRPPVDPDAVEIVRRAAPFEVSLPEPGESYMPPLLARPPVIPLRSSTPVTALRIEQAHRWRGGDAYGLIRGRITHRAIEARYGPGPVIEVPTIARQEAPAVSDEVRAALVADVEEMLARFGASEVASQLASPGAMPRFEAPFAWDWDGVPVHGQIDLLYRLGGRWRVVDFKTDRVSASGIEGASRPYLVQLGLYARAIEAATHERPSAGLLFLRLGHWYEPPWSAIDAALADARRRIDGGPVLDPELAEYLAAGDE